MRKVVGKMLTGVSDLVSVLQEISKDKVGLTLEDGTYYVEAIEEYDELGYVEAMDLGVVEDKYAESVYDNQDLEDYEQNDLIDKIPKARIPLKDYMGNEVAQELYDYAISLDPGMYYLKYDAKTKELYLIVAKNW